MNDKKSFKWSPTQMFHQILKIEKTHTCHDFKKLFPVLQPRTNGAEPQPISCSYQWQFSNEREQTKTLYSPATMPKISVLNIMIKFYPQSNSGMICK